jgi:putative transposase
VGTQEEKMDIKDDDKKRREAIALFRYGVISDLVRLPRGHRGLATLIGKRAEQTYDIPGSRRGRVAAETMRDWLGAYRRGGFEALLPKPRSDQGQARAIPQAMADQLCTIREDNPGWSVRMVIAEAVKSGQVPDGMELAPATVHRVLSRAGLMERGTDEPSSNDRRRFSFIKAGQLWMSDVMHGPSVVVEGKRRRKTYLISFLDDATRVIPFATFALGENVACFLPVFEQAIRRRGIPQRLYVDNGAAYRSQHLSLVCARLGTTLIHARPYQPQGKGKQERWHREVRRQCLGTLVEQDTSSLEALNRKLWSWVEGEYHQAPHKGLDGETPHGRWAQVSDEVRLPDANCDLGAIFLFEERRKVHKDRTVSLRGVVYEVDAAFVGETVTLRFDPSRVGKPVEIWVKGRKVAMAKRVDAYANCFVKRSNETRDTLQSDGAAPTPAEGLRMRDFNEGAPPAAGSSTYVNGQEGGR